MKEPSMIYVVRFWVAPDALSGMMKWLDGSHVKEVVSQPGFLWCRRLDLKHTDERGWSAHSMIYGIESKAAFDVYSANKALMDKFAREREPFAASLRMERFFGDVTQAVDHD